MSELHFKIVIVLNHQLDPTKKHNLLYDVRNSIEKCNVQVSYIDFFQATKSDVEFHPEIEELALQVEAVCDSSYPRISRLQYVQFCRTFKLQCSLISCYYIMLHSDDSFMAPRESRNVIKHINLQFGVIPHDSYFHEYTSLEKADKIIFYHDSRNVVIETGEFELRFTYDNIRNVFVNIRACPSELFLDLFNPPIINRLESCVQNGFRSIIRHRNLDMNGKIDPDILGRACVLRLTIYNHNMDLDMIVSNIRSRCSSKPIYYSPISLMKKYKPSANAILNSYSMEFSCIYMMTAIFQRDFVLLAQLSSERDYLRVIDLSMKDPKALETALTDVLTTLASGKILNYWNVIENRFYYYHGLRTNIDFKEYIIPPNCCMTRRITVTPTRLLLWAPELLFGNRVVRNFDPEFAIRVSFRDDNMRKLTSSALNADSGFMQYCVNAPVSNGLGIGSRRYEFLAWSNSQLRDHGVWMYAKDLKDITSADIRQWMGDFSSIHNVPKYMARMGQCFSQTIDTISIPLEPHLIRTVPDIERGFDSENGKPYNFSDGIGRISTELAAKVHKALDHDKLCCAFQIRYGGYKGMLVIDPTLKDIQIEFRESMKKFECPNSTRLEIARTSAPGSLQLNRPLIAILNDLGVRHRVFLRLQENMLKSVTDMLFDEEIAAKILKSKTQAMYEFEDLSHAGIHLTTEPFFRSILLAVHRYQIGLLKAKANVSIDHDYGRNMLGVLDETGILNYGEVFVQYSKDLDYGETIRDTKVLEGVVLVTKSPCHHPGDVRKFYAVDVPELHHIVDCIVFPQNGPRPHPNEMAGADLDGDEFAVIWLPELIFQCANKPAATFPSMKSQDKSIITIEDMVECFEEYIRKDQVGMISHAHLALIDKFGVEDAVSRAVARKISIAVDFAKTGQVVPLTKKEKPKEYPDFMENTSREEYKSIKALGKMYRICRDYETENKETCTMCNSIQVDPDLVYPGWEKYETDAIKMRNKYNAILDSLLRNYGIEHEAEVISTAFTELHCRYQERNDRMDIMKVVIACFRKLLSEFKLEFFEEFTMTNAAYMDEAALQKASAWYIVTYSSSDPKHLSFPWIVHHYLAIIKMKLNHDEVQPFSPAILKFDAKILDCEKYNLLPSYEETSIWRNYTYLSDLQILKRALKVLILWATEEEIIVTPGRHKGLLYVDVFIKVFFHVAELCKYVTKSSVNENTMSENKAYSSGKLCVEFLKFCSSLRFYNKNDIHEILPFYVYKHTKLAKRAVVAYHKFALSGIFRNLYFDKRIDDDLIDMNPISIDFKIFGQNPIPKSALKKAEEALKKYSDVQFIYLSDHCQTRKVWISAVGSERAIKDLKSILRKTPEFLQELFKTGKVPEKDVSIIDIIGKKKGNVSKTDLSQEDDIFVVAEIGKKRINISNNETNGKRTKN